ncbi:MAG: NAD-dependent epimerase/dehydratase family protein [Archangium sp.]|nr:NAD-dependent epimerase/dehydratase family protein [Archangium sp.]
MALTVAVIGASGYVGSALCASPHLTSSYDVVRVTRETYAACKRERYDVVINCAMPSARFKARNDPAWDFEATVKTTAELLYGWRYEKFVQVSSVSARCQLDSVYGRHKAAAERLCAPEKALIVRLGPLYSAELKKGVLVDMARGQKVFVDGSSRYCFAPLAFSTQWLATNLHRVGTVEVGGRNAIALSDVAAHLGLEVEFEGAVDHQEIDAAEPGFPEARDVLSFMKQWRVGERA